MLVEQGAGQEGGQDAQAGKGQPGRGVAEAGNPSRQHSRHADARPPPAPATGGGGAILHDPPLKFLPSPTFWVDGLLIP